MAQLVGISRVSIRKYVMFLTDIGVLENEMMYQHVGRPVSKLRCVDQKKKSFTYKRLSISRLYFLIQNQLQNLQNYFTIESVLILLLRKRGVPYGNSKECGSGIIF